MAIPRMLTLRAPGINCDEETAFAWQQAGGLPERVHVNRLCENPRMLDAFQMLAIPGGFSYGDDIASGKILANQLAQRLGDALSRFVDRGGLIAGICNGFQVLVRLGLLPGGDCGVDVTLALNESGRYEDRWVVLRGETDRCPFLERGAEYYLPVAHGEGRIATANGLQDAAKLADAGRVALRYVTKSSAGSDTAVASPPFEKKERAAKPLLTEQWHTRREFPANPNGSIDNIAGLIDSTGRVFGLMPHPERCMFATQVPAGLGG
ncbi:MAG TPA: phosphoribosylformylglycinamidine synthase subunit PurQ, partial [Phycisphaerae bacterium]|nr:phosphoribosylformylglycinamidine synthase subunit PurQ [Phycisphaerae bacterium]